MARLGDRELGAAGGAHDKHQGRAMDSLLRRVRVLVCWREAARGAFEPQGLGTVRLAGVVMMAVAPQAPTF